MAQFFMMLFIFIIYLILKFVWDSFYKDDDSYVEKLEEAYRELGVVDQQYKEIEKNFEDLRGSYFLLQERFEKLQHQKISADVKMGQKSENLLPFLQDFPYPTEDIRGLFNPIDLVAFTDTEVIFVEVKTGTASLSEKQRRIRDNIKAGRVRFEVHRMNEKGVTVK